MVVISFFINVMIIIIFFNLDCLMVYSEHKALLELMGIHQSQIDVRMKEEFLSWFKTKVTTNIAQIVYCLMLCFI